jgi:hypothetical protein
VLAVVLVGGLGLAAWAATRPRSPEQRAEAARELAVGIHVSATVLASSLAATGAIADFGLDDGIRLVHVRILDEIELELRIEADRDVTLAGPPRLCLVGPSPAPDDAGLSDRCWGEPDLGALLAAKLEGDPSGRVSVEAARPTTFSATLRRGDVRCDYPPGAWQLEVAVDPLVDGSPVSGVAIAPISLEVPWETEDPLPLLGVDRTRYCGLASVVYREQGEPPVASP